MQKLKNVTEDSFLHDYSVDTNNINGWIDKIVPRLNRCEKEKIFLESDTLLRLRFTAVGIQLQIDYEKAKREFDEKAKSFGHGKSDFYTMYNFAEKVLGDENADIISVLTKYTKVLKFQMRRTGPCLGEFFKMWYFS